MNAMDAGGFVGVVVLVAFVVIALLVAGVALYWSIMPY